MSAPGSNDSGTVLWCAAYTDVQRWYPCLPQAHDQDDLLEQGENTCVDFTVTVDGGRLTAIEFEAHSLAETFEIVGSPDDASAVLAVIGEDLMASIPTLTNLVSRLLQRRELAG